MACIPGTRLSTGPAQYRDQHGTALGQKRQYYHRQRQEPHDQYRPQHDSYEFGDVNMYVTYRLPTPDKSNINYHVTGRVKLGTADSDKGLGTGENDYALGGGARTLYETVITRVSVRT